MNTWPPTCHFCGLFMSYDDMDEAVTYTPFGNIYAPELGPPDTRYIHLVCWADSPEDRRERTRQIAWSGPHIPQGVKDAG